MPAALSGARLEETLEAESLTPPPRCDRCRDVIGVYEPLVHVFEGQARETSRAAEHPHWSPDGACYHTHCYAADLAGADL